MSLVHPDAGWRAAAPCARALLSLAAFALVFAPGSADAQASLVNGFGGVAGYGTQCLSPNDDGSSAEIDLTPYFPSGLRFFDRTHTSVFVNTNGNITFSARLSQYTPDPFPVADQPMIAPYWADVDIRYTGGSCMGSDGTTCTNCSPCHNPTENGVWWTLSEGRMVVTWDRVGYYDCHNDKRMSFQLILTAAPGCGGEGDFDVEFRFNRCDWETGDASDGTGGFGGTEAQAGFDAGNERDYVSIEGSREAGIAAHLCRDSNVGETGIWRFQIRGGSVVCPDAGAPCATGGVGVCGQGRTNCVGSGTECVQEVPMGPERCDALDNDCDGNVDEGEGLCGALAVCDRGVCVEGCFEGGCAAGETCSAQGLCVDAACEAVTCPEGQRCRDGACVGACDGVVCPLDQVCRSGRCITPCEGLTCDECSVCDEGLCVPTCDDAGCGAGETCMPDGRCVDSGCVSVTCTTGTVCRGGACVDACATAVCPSGERCAAGACVVDDGSTPPPPTDGGDAGGGGPPPPAGGDASVPPGTDAGTGGEQSDAGRRVPGTGADPGCSCRVPGEGGPGRGLPTAILGVALVGLAMRRRR